MHLKHANLTEIVSAGSPNHYYKLITIVKMQFPLSLEALKSRQSAQVEKAIQTGDKR
jgi:hypothetical protein